MNTIRIAHQLSTRTRLVVHELDCTLQTMEAIAQALKTIPSVQSVEYRLITGSIILLHDEDASINEQIQAVLDSLDAEIAPKEAEEKDNPADDLLLAAIGCNLLLNAAASTEVPFLPIITMLALEHINGRNPIDYVKSLHPIEIAFLGLDLYTDIRRIIP